MGNQVQHRQLRMFSMMAVAIIAAALGILVLLLVPGIGGATITGDAPPSSGDWVITSDTTVTGETLDIDGNVTVRADLSVSSSTIRIVGALDGSVGIHVRSGGHLSVTDSSIVSANGNRYTFTVQDGMDLLRVTIRNVGGGLVVNTTGTVTIDRVRFLDFSGPGLVLKDADGTTVTDVVFQADDYETSHGVSLSTDGADPFVEWEYEHPGIIHILDGSPVVDGVDISINGTFALDLSYRKANPGGGVSLMLEWALVYVDSGETVRVSNVTFRDSTIYNTIRAAVTDTASSSFDLTVDYGVDVFLVRDYRDVSVSGVAVESITYYMAHLNVTGVPETSVNLIQTTWNLRAVHAFVSETFTTVGPHSFDLEVRDVHVSRMPILYHHLDLDYSGSTSPTFDSEVLLDDVSTDWTVRPVVFEINPRFELEKKVRARVTVSNGTFEWLGTSAITVDYRSGPAAPLRRGLELHATTTVADCRFTRSNTGTHGLINVPRGIAEPNLDDNTFIVRGCTFSNNIGTLLNVNGSVTLTRDVLIVDGNDFNNNTAWKDQRTMNIQYRTVVEFTNNTVSDNNCSQGIHIYDPGANSVRKDRCMLVIANNSFVGNWDNPYEVAPGAIVHVQWGGVLVVRDNVISDSGVVFLNLTEAPEESGWSTLDFHHNRVLRNENAVLYFNRNDRFHMDLEATIRNNTVWDNEGALVDFATSSEIFPYDYDATYLLLDNDVRRAGSTVFSNYGNITVSGNTFVECAGWVLKLENLRVERPFLTDNTFTRCGDAVLIRAKPNVPVPVLMWMDNNRIDSSGTAIYLSQIQLTLRTTTITSANGSALVADMSLVDAYDCDFEMDACEVVVDGYIRMWYWVEAWVYWASKEGIATTNPVVDANVTFIDQHGVESLTVYADEEGHVEPAEVLAWHIEHSTAPVAKNPYTISVSLSSFSTSVTVNVTASHKGPGAMVLLLWDPEDPLVSIDSPEHQSAHNTIDLEISGFATDKASGVYILNVRIAGVVSVNATIDGAGTYIVVLENLPEGILEVRATVRDHGLNTATDSISVEIDRTPPRLVVTHPSEELHTNSTTVNIRGEVEVGALLVINMKEYSTLTGIIDVTLSLNEGPNYFGLTASDLAGNTATVVVWVHRDTFDPELTLFGPSDGSYTNVSDVRVWGAASDYDSVTLSVHRRFTNIIDRPIYPGDDDQFDVLAELEEGENEIIVTASDLAGNRVTIRRTVFLDTVAPVLELVSPEDNALLNRHQVNVVFTVSDDAEQVYVNGRRVLGTGQQETVIMLVEGDNPIRIEAIDLLWNRAIVELVVRVDTVAPVLELYVPSRDTIKTNDRLVEVRGRVYDVDASGSPIDREGITVGGEVVDTFTIDGNFIHNLMLQEDGVHRVDVVAKDRAGNTALATFTVDLRTQSPVMTLVFDPADDRLDPGSVLRILGSAVDVPLNVTIVHGFDGDSEEHTFLMDSGTFLFELDLVDGTNTISVRSVDTYGNYNLTEPHTVEVRERTVEPSTDNTMWYVLLAVVAAAVVIGIVYVAVRRSNGTV